MKNRVISLCIVIALLLSITPQTIAVSGSAISNSADYSSANSWIAQHIEYSSSDEYSQEIIPGFHSRMLAVFRDALDDDSIKGYNSAKLTAELLDLDPNLNEVDVYTILLAEILYSRPGTKLAENSYEISLTSSMVNTTQSLLNLVDAAENTKELSSEALKSIIDLGELIQSTDLNASDLGNAYSKFIHLIEENFNDVQVKTALKTDATLEAFSFAIDTGFEICDSVVDTMHYVNNYIAYQETSEQFQRILEQFLVYLYENMGNHGLDGVDAFSELGITEAIFNWGDLSVAVADFLKTAQQYEQEVSSAVAKYAVEKIHQTGSAVSENAKRTLIVFGLDFICAKIPILNAIPILKTSLNVGLVLAECTTNVDDKAYLLNMLTKTYCISVMLDEIVQNCANDMLTKKDHVLYYASVFDEAIDLYKGNQLIAIEYAINYTKILLNEANSELNDYSKGGFFKRIFINQDKLKQTVVWYENSLKLLEEQRSDIMAISCHNINPTDLTDSNNSGSFTKKRPSTIVTYASGKESEEYHFTYNDLGQVVGMDAYRYKDGNAIQWYNEKYEYDKSGNLTLTESRFSSGSSNSYHYMYDYDSTGRITGYNFTEYYEDAAGLSDYYTLSYDNQGRCIKKQDKNNSSVEEYSYDESSGLAYSLHEYDHGDAHFTDSATYDYSYAPLIISSYSSISNSEVYGNHSGKSIAFMPHWNLTLADWNIDDSCTFDADSDGYLLRVVDADGENVYVCHYEESITDTEQSVNSFSSDDQAWAAAYIPTVEKALSKANQCSGGSRYGILNNMDDDATPELILSYPVMEKGSNWIWYYAFSVYDYEDGSLKTIMEDESIGASEAAAGGGGGTSVVFYKNTPMIIAYRTQGETSDSGGQYVKRDCEAFLYSFGSTTPTQTFSAKAGKDEITYSLNSQKVSERDFLEEIRNYTYLTYDNEWWISFSMDYPVTELYTLLGNLQKTANLSPSSEPIIPNDDAESIAHLYWDDELSQDDEYKLIQIENIIAEGVMYYRFELHINYVADKWAVYQTVFIDSVTGNCVNSLF